MGCRMSTNGHGVGAAVAGEASITVPGPDASSMDLEQLVRRGISEAQMATVARIKRDRTLHLHRARALLIEALKRCGGNDKDLRMHLLAVLLKLGEDARSISGFTAEVPNQGQHNEGQIPASNDVQCRSSPSHAEEVGAGRSTPSEHSSEDAEANIPNSDYIGLNEHLLLEDSEDNSSTASLTNAASLPSPEHGADGEASPTVVGKAWVASSLLIGSRPTILSSVQEGHEDVCGHGTATQLGKTKEHTVLEDSAGSAASSTAGKLSSALAGLENHLDEAPPSVPFGEWPSQWQQLEDGSPGFHRAHSTSSPPPAARPLSPQSAALGRTSSWPILADAASSDSKDPLQLRARALQPQQASSSQLSSSSKRRQARGADGFSPSLGSRHSRRQPSQSSSSGSQGNVSDSEGSSIAKRACMPFAASIEEEPATYTDMLSGSFRCGGATDGVHNFEPPARGASVEDEQRDSAAASNNCSRSPLGSSYASEEGCTRTPPLETRTPNESPSVLATSAPGTSLVEKATPSQEVDVKNPLSHPEFRDRSSSVNSQPSSVIASPCTESLKSRSPSASWSVGGSGMQMVGMSPFCDGASPFNAIASPFPNSALASPFPNSALASPQGACSVPSRSDKVSVRILNGVSGEEEVRFPAPVEASFSEQNFYSMLDGLCQKHAGQALSDMNWLNQAQPNARFQRRKCDLGMVEELFSEDATSKRKGPMVLLLCTVPAKPPSELPANRVRLRNIIPSHVCFGAIQPLRLQVDTSLLETSQRYTVAFTHQWTNVTYSAEASLLANCRGVELSVPWQILTAAGSTTEGLYDVHLVTDCSYRSENRRTLTIGSAESEISASGTDLSTATGSGFVPLNRGGTAPA